jgi:hypothetical protein
MTLRTVFVAAICSAVLLPLPAFAAVPAGCSAGPIVDKPVFGSVAGKPFVPNKTSMQITRDGMEVGNAKFDRYVLSIETDGIFNEATVDMLVPLGKKPDGRTFRVLPVDSIGDQPAATEGTPEVQGWSLALESAGVDASFTEDVASLRVELGARKGNAIPGKIHLCVPGKHAEIQGSFTATFDN